MTVPAKSAEFAKSYPRSICACGHSGDGANSYHAGAGPVGFPVHSCEPENPCPVLAGAECEGSDPAKWSRGALPEVVTADGQGDLFAGQ